MNSAPHQRGNEDPYDLNRFLQAQAGVYERALAELKRGCKESHWMWFIFPQIDGLGRSPTTRLYAIKSAEEAKAYLTHPVLGSRLKECVRVLLQLPVKSAADIFGYPDDMKLRSSMTLFANAAEPGSVFSGVLEEYFEARPDSQTLTLLERPAVG
jgi:uncharacterized protein (DUF1810 family)